MPVVEAEDKQPLPHGAVAIAPPDYHLLAERAGHLALSVDAPVHWSRPSIDVLFESAADAFGDRLLALVLTGANQDGAAGLARVHARGGATVVQRPDEALAAEMPRPRWRRCRTRKSARCRDCGAVPPTAPKPKHSMNNPRILLVDDLEENLIALAALLAQDGVELLTARSGRHALELLLEQGDIALALLDVQMPEMDGFELAELMRGNQRTKDIPIIFVTAGTTDRTRVFKGYESGAVDFLPKPIEPQVLRSKATVFLRLFRQQQQLAHELAERTEHLRLIELFNAVLGHDLRTPLSAISMAGMVLTKRAGDDVSRRMATSVVSSARRMGGMIEDLLDVGAHPPRRWLQPRTDIGGSATAARRGGERTADDPPRHAHRVQRRGRNHREPGTRGAWGRRLQTCSAMRKNMAHRACLWR